MTPAPPETPQPADDLRPAPFVPPEPHGPQARVRTLDWAQPGRWLALGWKDLWSFPGVSGFFGLSFWVMALGIAWTFQTMPQYTMSMACGCLLVGPFWALGLYDISRRKLSGQTVSRWAALTCWRAHVRSLGLLVLVLLVLELLWGRASLVVFAVFFDTGWPSSSSVLAAVFKPENYAFIAVYTAVGGIFAALVYSTTVVSIPMILDRDTDAISATIVSMRVVYDHPGVMLLWGAIITLLVVLALSWWHAVGLILIGPWLGHASWHAYCGTVQWIDAESSQPYR